MPDNACPRRQDIRRMFTLVKPSTQIYQQALAPSHVPLIKRVKRCQLVFEEIRRPCQMEGRIILFGWEIETPCVVVRITAFGFGVLKACDKSMVCLLIVPFEIEFQPVAVRHSPEALPIMGRTISKPRHILHKVRWI